MERLRASGWSRRHVLSGSLSIGLVAVAGCLDGTDGDDAAGDDGSNGNAAELELVDHPGDEPTDVPTSTCPVCSMQPQQYDEWNAQLAHEDEGGLFFDTTGCLFAYLTDPTAFGGPEADVGGVWVTDFETHETIDATAATFVLEHDDGRLDDPMAPNPLPFADEDDATAYVDSYDDLDESDLAAYDGVRSEDAGRWSSHAP
ncbi:nitrous oxide reductase accessory protein NosL [Halobacteria archaeon AArc-dxtr1]|nr:nitrous oxide reductase accessory protein NosL [Halobacteria archaeon AArc-dxtr1]